MRARRLAATFVLGLAGTGCAARVRSTAGDLPRIALPVVVDESLKAMERPETRRRLEAIAATPEMQRAIASAAAAAAQGFFATLGQEQSPSRENLERLTRDLTTAISRAIAEQLRTEVGPVVVSSVRGAFTDEDRRAMEQLMAGVVASATQAAMRAAARELPETVGPAFRESLVTALGHQDLRNALSGAAAEVTRQTLVSTHHTIAETIAESREAGKPTFIDRLQRYASWAFAFAVTLGGVTIAIAVWALHSRSQVKRLRSVLAALVKERQARGDHDEDARLGSLVDLLT